MTIDEMTYVDLCRCCENRTENGQLKCAAAVYGQSRHQSTIWVTITELKMLTPVAGHLRQDARQSSSSAAISTAPGLAHRWHIFPLFSPP